MNYLCEKQKDIMSKTNKYNNDFYYRISEILKSARNKVVKTVNATMVETYFEIGRLIVVDLFDIQLCHISTLKRNRPNLYSELSWI